MADQALIEQNREIEVVDTSNAPSTADIAKGRTGNERPESLFSNDETQNFRKRWEQIQTEFVDDPRDSVQKADQLVATTVQRLAEVFAEQKSRLEHEWDKGDNVSTEDLRQALRKYRSFFDRLLTV